MQHSPETIPGALRLSPGCALFPHAGGWCLYGPGDRFARIGGPADDIAHVAALLDTGALTPATLDGSPATAQLVAALRARGVLTADVVQAARTPRILAIGDAATRTALRAAFGDAARLVERDGAGDIGAREAGKVQAAVWVAGTLPDAAWQRFDRCCVDAGIPWHMAYVEAGAAVLGPLAVPDRTATYRDTRRRRLGASVAAAELRALWAHLDRAPQAVSLEPHAAALVAGFIAADLLALVRGGSAAAPATQRVINLSTMAISQHTVLPVPAFAAIAEGPE